MPATSPLIFSYVLPITTIMKKGGISMLKKILTLITDSVLRIADRFGRDNSASDGKYR